MTRLEMPRGLMRRVHTAAVLAFACLAFVPRVARAQPAPAPADNASADDAETKPADSNKPADAKPEGETKPEDTKPTPDAAAPVADTKTPVPPEPTTAVKDEMDAAGYIPGYRKSMGLGVAPWVPRVGSVPGGFTPSFAAPSTSSDWNFNFTGYMSAALRTSFSDRKSPASPDQHTSAYHSPPVTADQYGTFTGTNTVPGSWADMTFQYGNRYVTGYVSIATYDPSRAASYTNPGSQYLLNNVYMTIRVPPLDHARMSFTVGAVPNFYGPLEQYGVGAYAPYVIGWVPGVGETADFEYDLTSNLTLQVEQGIRGVIASPPAGLINNNSTGYANQNWPASWVHHEHIGFLHKGDVQVQGALHYFYNWSMDDRNKQPFDDTMTVGVDESNPKDGHISELGADFRILGGHYGYFAAAGAYTKGRDSALLTGLNTYGGTGVRLFKDWWGQNSHGNGTLAVVALEYNLSIGTLLRYPQPFWGEGPDLIGMVAFQHAQTTSDDPQFDGRARNKFGTEWTYRFLSWFGIGARYDHVAPNSKDSLETFDVITPKLYFKSNWTSHELVTVQYARWFYGAHTAAQGTDPVAHENLDNQMLSVAFGMWW
jgi:hypothetical protein